MTKFLPLLFCAAVLSTNMAHAKDKPLEISKDNFVSLQWFRSGGFAGVNERYTIQNHEIIQPGQRRGGFSSPGGYSGPPRVEDVVVVDPPRSVPMSENQWSSLIEELKKADVPAIAGNYKQEGLTDGFNETLMLTISDSDDLDQTFTISNYGSKAPASYYNLSAYLSALLSRKFAPPTPSQTTSTSVANAQQKPEVSNDNFVSLLWTQGSGRAGSETYTIQNHQVLRTGGRSPFSPMGADTSASSPQLRMFFESDWKELLEQLRKLNVSAIAGTYEQKDLFDGPGQNLVLTLSNGNKSHQTFTVSNYGFDAPAAFAKFHGYLSSLLASKFAFLPASPPTVRTPQ